MGRLLRAGGYAFQPFTAAADFLAKRPTDCQGCILVDLQMPGLSGLDFQAALAKTTNPLPLIFLTGHGDIPTSVQAVRQGAEDFLTKPVKKEALFAAINRGLARNAAERRQRAAHQEACNRFETLTPRERDVLSHILRGRLNKQIAADLGTSERTIKAHRANIMTKVKAGSVAELARLAHEAEF